MQNRFRKATALLFFRQLSSRSIKSPQRNFSTEQKLTIIQSKKENDNTKREKQEKRAATSADNLAKRSDDLMDPFSLNPLSPISVNPLNLNNIMDSTPSVSKHTAASKTENSPPECGFFGRPLKEPEFQKQEDHSIQSPDGKIDYDDSHSSNHDFDY